MKSDIFSLKRATQYFASDVKTCISNFGVSFISMTAVTPIATYIIFYLAHLVFGHGEWGGVGILTRAITFGVVLTILMLTQPSQCYGRITEKQYGTSFLTLPASTFEKFLSMVIICAILTPLAGVCIYWSIDALICLLDKNCGIGIAEGIFNLGTILSELRTELMDINNMDISTITDQISPWLFIDDAIQISLPFILGAIYFKKSKISKTILAFIGISIVCSLLFSSFFNFERFSQSVCFQDAWWIRNFALIDTISDTIVNLILLALIYIRLRTIKH